MASTYADRINGVETSTAIKSPVLVATVANITLSGLQTIDGVTVVAGDRVLVRSQDNPVNNGIWNASTGAWTRSIDFNGSRDIAYGTVVYIASGSTLGNAYAIQSYSAPVIGVSQILFSTVAGSVSEAAAAASATAAEAARDEAEVLVNSIKSPSLFAARNVADLLAPVAVPTGLLDTVVLKKLRADYGECAAYFNSVAGGTEWARVMFSQRFNSGLGGLPRHLLTSVAGLYAKTDIARWAANNVSETRASAVTVSKASSTGTKVGTWSTAATVLTTTDVTWSATVGDTITFSVTGAQRIELRGLMAGNGGIGKVTIKESGVEIDEANYLLPAGHLVNFISTATGNTTMHFPLAEGLNSGLTYDVEIKVDASNPATYRVYTAGLRCFDDVAFDAVGIHGIVLDAILGGFTNSMSIAPGTRTVYQATDATKVDWRYIQTPAAGIATLKIYSAAGALVSTVTLDQYAVGSTALKAVAARDKTKATYYLHVINGKTKNAASTAYRFYETGVVKYDQSIAGIAGTDAFDDNDIPSNIISPNMGSEWVLVANGNLEQATRIKKPAEAYGARDYVGGIHGKETLNSLVYKVDGAVIDYVGAAVGAQFVGAREISMTASVTLGFPSDSSAWATVDHELKVTKYGYSVKSTITTTADATVYDDFAAMLICPNTQMSGGTYGKSQGGQTGGGFELVAWDKNYTINAYNNDGTIIADPARSMAFVNAEYLVICTINTVTIPDLFKTTPFRDSEAFGLIQDRTDNTIKSYFRSFVGDPANGVTIPAATTWGYSKHYRTFKGDFRAVLGA